MTVGTSLTVSANFSSNFALLSDFSSASPVDFEYDATNDPSFGSSSARLRRQ
jgi:hypothetical protein